MVDPYNGQIYFSEFSHGVHKCVTITETLQPSMAPSAFNEASQSFSCTGSQQTFTVPVGIRFLIIEAYGAQGGGGIADPIAYPGGRGAMITANVTVTPGSVLYVNVGCTTASTAGGYNGGGNGATNGGGGGGASDVRLTSADLSSRIVVAGGGGGSYWNSATCLSYGGAGGITIGQPGGNSGCGMGGAGGTQSSGGARGYHSACTTAHSGLVAIGGNGCSVVVAEEAIMGEAAVLMVELVEVGQVTQQVR
jgi:hypothetical protein